MDSYPQEYPILTEKLTCAEYEKGYFSRGWNTIKLITYKINSYSTSTPTIRFEIVSHVSPKSWMGYNGGSNLPTLILARHKKRHPKESHRIRRMLR